MIPLPQQADDFVAKMLASALPASAACYKSYVAGWKAAVEECAKAANSIAIALLTKATGDDYEPGSRDWCEVMDQAFGARQSEEAIRAMVSA